MSADNNVDLQEVTNQLLAGSNMSPELAEIFSEEAEEHMRTIYDGMDRMRADNSDIAALGDVRRASHTLKGAAGAVGMEAVTRLSHRMEDLLDNLAESQQNASEKQIHLLLATADQLQDLTTTEIDIDKTAKILMELYGQYEEEMLALGGSASEQQGEESSSQAVEANVEDDIEAELAAALAGLGESIEDDLEIAAVAAEAIKKTPAAAKVAADAKPAAAESAVVKAPKTAQASPSKESTQFLRVPLERIDNLVGLVGEMIVNRSSFAQRLTDMEQRIEDMQTALARFRSVAHDVETRYSVEALRSGTRSNSAQAPAKNNVHSQAMQIVRILLIV